MCVSLWPQRVRSHIASDSEVSASIDELMPSFERPCSALMYTWFTHGESWHDGGVHTSLASFKCCCLPTLITKAIQHDYKQEKEGIPGSVKADKWKRLSECSVLCFNHLSSLSRIIYLVQLYFHDGQLTCLQPLWASTAENRNIVRVSLFFVDKALITWDKLAFHRHFIASNYVVSSPSTILGSSKRYRRLYSCLLWEYSC